MYCRKCKNLLPENEFICNNCKFDNFFESAYQESLKDVKKVKKNNNSSVFSVVVLFFLLCVGVVLFYSVSESKAVDPNVAIQPTNTIKIVLNKYAFFFEDFKFTYLESFGTSTNTIFYKKNTDININIKTILNEEYQTIINSNDCLETSIMNIPAHTYAGDNFYSYVFTYNNKYYDITVNYINDTSVYTEKIQSDISNIIKSIEIV